jgi:transposase InsO family protein
MHHQSHRDGGHRQAPLAAGAINESWSTDFVSDALFDGRRIQALTVVDNFSRKSLAIEVGQGVTGAQVVGVMNRIVAGRGLRKLFGSTTPLSSCHARSTSGISAPGHARLQPPGQAN